ncbi:hypothetical protein HDU85_000011 [Gaertneriomyces sp. JEL0708]|nr:hypothetical protein HDU85_000011 [Gaertneriomyces sp. JEL0708]
MKSGGSAPPPDMADSVNELEASAAKPTKGRGGTRGRARGQGRAVRGGSRGRGRAGKVPAAAASAVTSAAPASVTQASTLHHFFSRAAPSTSSADVTPESSHVDPSSLSVPASSTALRKPRTIKRTGSDDEFGTTPAAEGGDDDDEESDFHVSEASEDSDVDGAHENEEDEDVIIPIGNATAPSTRGSRTTRRTAAQPADSADRPNADTPSQKTDAFIELRRRICQVLEERVLGNTRGGAAAFTQQQDAEASSIGGQDDDGQEGGDAISENGKKRKVDWKPPTSAKKLKHANPSGYFFNAVAADKRINCVLPSCDKTLTTIPGYKYHLATYVHEILAFLTWAFPKEHSGNQNPASLNVLGDPSQFIQEDILNLYESTATEDWPLVIEDYPGSLPGIIKLVKISVTLGYSKERRVGPRSSKIKSHLDGGGASSRVTTPRPPSHLWKKRKSPQELHAAPTKAMIDIAETTTIATNLFPKVRPRVEDFSRVDLADAAPFCPSRTVRIVSVATPRAQSERVSLNLFEGKALPEVGKKRLRYAINTGGSVWGLDWCPVPAATDGYQYLAVAGYKNNETEHHIIGVRQVSSGPDDSHLKGCIQIYRVPASDSHHSAATPEQPKLVLCILHEHGFVQHLQWAPRGYYEARNDVASTDPGDLPRLGLLAATFGDGSLKVFNIPHPQALECQSGVAPVAANTTFYHIRPENAILSVMLPDSLLCRVAWDASERLAAGCSNGDVLVWSIRDIMQAREAQVVGQANQTAHSVACTPTLRFPNHDSYIRSITWTTPAGVPVSAASTSENMLITSSNDGRLLARDLRDLWNGLTLYRIRGFLHCVAWCSDFGAVVFSDAENGVRYLKPGEEDTKSAKRKSEEDDATGMCQIQRTQCLLQHRACVWDLSSSMYLPFVASASTDGAVKLSNIHRLGQRAQRPAQVDLYSLSINQDTGVYTFMENVKPEVIGNVSADTMFFEEEVAVQKVVWNPHPSAASWVASGGTSGLVRIESTYGLPTDV